MQPSWLAKHFCPVRGKMLRSWSWCPVHSNISIDSFCGMCAHSVQAAPLQVHVLEDSAGKLGAEPAPAPVLSWTAFRALCEAPPLQARCHATLVAACCTSQ